MKTETLQRALVAVRELLVVADRNLSNWREVRDRRRRQEAAFLRGIVRIEGSQRKAAIVTGLSQPTISRTLDLDAHKRVREAQAKRDARKRNLASPELERGDVRNQNLTSSELETGDATNPNVASPENVVLLHKRRRRRPDWERREPRRPEMHKWYEQYFGWTLTAQATARMVLFNADKERLPDAAYYDDEQRSADRNGPVGQEKGSSGRTA